MVARAIGGVMAGMVIAFVVVLAIEMIGIRIFPQAAGMNPLDAESGLPGPALARP
jgi:hypothetical protein